MSKKLLLAGLAVAGLALCGLAICVGLALWSPGPKTARRLPTLTPTRDQVTAPEILPAPTLQEPTLPTERSGEANRDLGQQPVDFGSANQARALLQLIEEEPGRAQYYIRYQTEVDAVAFGCDFDRDVIARIHQDPDGHGTQEAWTGFIMERMNNAAAGGSLNDTPAGNQPGTFETF